MKLPLHRRLAPRLALLFAATLVVMAAVAAAAHRWLTSPWAVFALTLAAGLPLGLALLGRLLRPTRESLAALRDGLRSFQDRDYSAHLVVDRRDEVGELLELYNAVCDALRDERTGLLQRELLLETVLQATPMAIVLADPRDRIVFANRAARELFATGGKPEGVRFAAIVERCPPAMAEALERGRDTLFTVEQEGERETYHLARRHFDLNTRRHTLYMIKHLTHELRRQEVAVWKETIRLLSHELNNTLAPISSLTRSARRILGDPRHAHRLGSILATIDDRAGHLKDFLDGYARFARLPRPRVEEVDWGPFTAELAEFVPFRLAGDLPSRPARFDPGQVQQVLINLFKNAAEAGSPEEEITLEVRALPDGAARVRVLDRGRGMEPEVLRQALLPFYSSKPGGSGVGLPLCREVVEAHGGRLALRNRDGGGLEVTLWLPGEGED